MPLPKKRNPVYSTVQIPTEIHKQLVEYCNLHGLKIGKFVGSLFLLHLSGSYNITV